MAALNHDPLAEVEDPEHIITHVVPSHISTPSTAYNIIADGVAGLIIMPPPHMARLHQGVDKLVNLYEG